MMHSKHKMPDGKMMKDSDMPMKDSKAKKGMKKKPAKKGY